MKPMTPKAASRKAATLARRLQAIFEETVNLRHELRESGFVPQNSEQELAEGALMWAFESVIAAQSRLENAAKYLADNRTEAEIKAYYAAARAEEAREETIKRYGCAA